MLALGGMALGMIVNGMVVKDQRMKQLQQYDPNHGPQSFQITPSGIQPSHSLRPPPPRHAPVTTQPPDELAYWDGSKWQPLQSNSQDK